MFPYLDIISEQGLTFYIPIFHLPSFVRNPKFCKALATIACGEDRLTRVYHAQLFNMDSMADTLIRTRIHMVSKTFYPPLNRPAITLATSSFHGES